LESVYVAVAVFEMTVFGAVTVAEAAFGMNRNAKAAATGSNRIAAVRPAERRRISCTEAIRNISNFLNKERSSKYIGARRRLL
jgi:hypothetical protein